MPFPIIRPMRRTMLAAAAALAALAACGAAQAQGAYPVKPITLISPYSAGGDADLAARTLAAAAQKVLGQPMVVVNRVGASGVIGSAAVVSAPPDGYTLLLARTGSQAILPAIQPTATKYKWDDYTFIGMLELNPYGCVVGAKSPYKTFAELVQAIRTNGKNLNYGTAGQLTTNDMGPRQLFRLLKLTPEQTPTQIPYKGTGEASASLVGGQTEFACGSMGPSLGLIKGGQLRALMVTTPERMSQLPDVPTARELGYAEMEPIVGWSALFGPPGLPADIRDKLADMLKKVAADPAWQAGTATTASLPYVKSPEETREFMRVQFQLYRSLGETLGLIDAKLP
ncbi:MAG: tripartite tricarboxylate transporter substrate binding protein [Rubrivivax sp.]